MMDYLLLQLEPLILVTATAVLSFGSYVVWPSRWNILAHLQVAFWFVAFVIPVAVLNVQDDFPEQSRLVLLKVMVLGVPCFVAGLFLGGAISRRGRLATRVQSMFEHNLSEGTFERRTYISIVAAIVMLVFALSVMGFVPILAADAFSAKFLRGEYAAAYRPVAVYYRAGTAGLSLLIAVAAALGWQRRSTSWRLLLLVSVGLMLATLQRGPAVTGLLVFLGVFLVSKGRVGTFLTLTFATYLVGTLFYAVLSYAGVGTFRNSTVVAQQQGIVETVASTAPDVSDTLGFIGRWEEYGRPTTSGRTIYGGVLPGNYRWNPGVWSITLGNQNVDITQVGSGGLRLPLPLWGLLCFGVPGVVVLSLISGYFVGLLSRLASYVVPCADKVMTVTALTYYSVLLGVLGTFYVSSYINLAQLVIIAFITRGAAKIRSAEPASDVPAGARGVQRAARSTGRHGISGHPGASST